jgi:predicted nucleic acid-binding protein
VIVVDCNVIAYLYLPSQYTPAAEVLLERQSNWAAPVLWRSEFRNILTGFMRRGRLTFEQAYRVQRDAESLLEEGVYEVDSFSVLELVQASKCSAYDCEYVALAMALDVTLVTVDKQLLRTFPTLTRALATA